MVKKTKKELSEIAKKAVASRRKNDPNWGMKITKKKQKSAGEGLTNVDPGNIKRRRKKRTKAIPLKALSKNRK